MPYRAPRLAGADDWRVESGRCVWQSRYGKRFPYGIDPGMCLACPELLNPIHPYYKPT